MPPMAKKYWLMKSEPNVYSIDHLAKDGTTWWEGVRNYQARNHMKDMNPGDEVLFYHSSADPTAVAGVARVTQSAQPDKTQFNKKSDYFEPRATIEKPVWFCVEIEFKTKFKLAPTLVEIKRQKNLSKMVLVQRGSRLSVQPATESEFQTILKMGTS